MYSVYADLFSAVLSVKYRYFYTSFELVQMPNLESC